MKRFDISYSAFVQNNERNTYLYNSTTTKSKPKKLVAKIVDSKYKYLLAYSPELLEIVEEFIEYFKDKNLENTVIYKRAIDIVDRIRP